MKNSPTARPGHAGEPLEPRVMLSLAPAPAALPRFDAFVGEFKGLDWFVEDVGIGRARLWASDDTEAGTTLMAELNTGASPIRPGFMTPVGDVAFFQVPTGQGLRLWKTDATPAGTVPLETDRVAVAGTMAALNGLLYFFAATAPRFDADLWQTDGTRDGTRKAADVKFITFYGEQSNLTRVGDYLWFDNEENFRRDDNLGGIWHSDGTAEGTFQVERSYTAGEFRADPDGRRVRLVNAPFVIDTINPSELHDPRLGEQAHPPYAGRVDVRFFHDADGDGVRDADEGAPPADVYRKLFAYADLDHDGTFDARLEPARRLSPDGTAMIPRVPDGATDVRVVDPASRFTTPQAVTVQVAGGQTAGPLTFGLNRNNRVSGAVYNDLDFDGVRQTGEPGIPGRRVFLDANANRAFDEGEPFALSGADGVYEIETLPNGAVRTDLPAGWRATDGADGFRHENLIVARDETFNFGTTDTPVPGTVFVAAFLDYDGDGTQGPQEPFATRLSLGFIDYDGDGVLDPGEPAGRQYGDQITFERILPGTYRPGIIGPPGWVVGNADWFTVESGKAWPAPPVGLRPSESASISGTVYFDDDFDGVRDAAEPGAAAGIVFLDKDGNGFWSDNVQTEPATMTDANGRYRFDHLAPGTYSVGFAVGFRPDVFNDVVPVSPRSPAVRTAEVTAGNVASGVDFGAVPSSQYSRASGRVYSDVNNDGTFDDGDLPLPNVLVYFDKRANDRLDPEDNSALTDADGRYNVGTYVGWQLIVVAVPAGWSAVPESEFSGGVQAVPFQTVAGPDFRLARVDPAATMPAGIRGVVFHDFDIDGVRDAFEPQGIYNQFILPYLPRPYIDLDGDGAWDEGEPLGVADDHGDFDFGGLRPGEYAVRLTTPAAWVQTTPAAIVTVGAGESAGPVTLGAADAPARVIGQVYLDANGNGHRDEGEGPAANFRVWLDANRDGSFDYAEGDRLEFTDESGRFRFYGLPPGTHDLSLRDNVNYSQTDPGDAPLRVTLAPEQVLSSVLLGIARTGAKLSGTFFYRDAGEAHGFTVRVQDVNNPARSWVTGALSDGHWVLNDLTAGTYRVTADLHSFGIPTGAMEQVVVLAEGQELGGINLGFRPWTVEISCTVYRDLDGDGVWDAGESGFPGIHVVASGRQGSGDAVTDATGHFLFNDLNPGNYSVYALRPPRTVRTFPWTGDFIDVIVQHSGDRAEVQPLGLYEPTTHVISGVVFDDANGNGSRDEDESMMSGRLVVLDMDHDGQLSLSDQVITTDPDGWYAFTRFDPRSEYRVMQVLPQDRVGTLPANGGWRVVTGGDPTETYTDVDLGSRGWAVVLQRQVLVRPPAAQGVAQIAALGDDPVASDKSVLLPGQAARFANVTNSTGGLSGIAIDVAQLPSGAGISFTADDFEFRAGTGGDPSTWTLAPAPSISVRRGAGTGGSDRLLLLWPSGAVKNTWLRITVKPTVNTGVQNPDVFYIGNLVGDTGDADAAPFRVNALDLAGIKRALASTTSIGGRFDFNRDGRINALDVAAVKQNLGRSLGSPSLSGPASVFFAGPVIDATAELTVRRIWDEASPGLM
jgi:ELWxxDGT repeat protein